LVAIDRLRANPLLIPNSLLVITISDYVIWRDLAEEELGD